MTARKLYLHVGPAKTGTSAVQSLLSSDDHAGLIYPKVGLWADGSHHNLVFNYCGDAHRPEIARAEPAELLARIGEETRARSGSVVISSELLANGVDTRKFAEAMLSFLEPADWSTEILFVAREHFERAASCYNQDVKDSVTMERREPDDYLRQEARELCYAPMLERCLASGPTTVVNYHPADTFVQRFLAAIGCRPADLQPQRRNVSLSTKALIATLAANRVARGAAERAPIFAALRRLRRFRSPSRPLFSPAARRQVEDLFAGDRLYLAERFGVELPSPDPAAVDEFRLSRDDLDDIARVTHELGELGAAVVEHATRYLAGGASAQRAAD